jgi:hypothetical protein
VKDLTRSINEALIFVSNVSLAEIVNPFGCNDVLLRIKKYRVSLTEEQEDEINIS